MMTRTAARLFILFLFPGFAYTQHVVLLTPPEFQKKINEPGVQILDVRTSKEYQAGHIKNALLADWNNPGQFRDRVQYIDKSKPVFIYCLSGARSTSAGEWMKNNGFINVYQLQGGIHAWKSDSLPVEIATSVAQMTITGYQALIGINGWVLVDFGAEWCAPCKQMEPVISSLQNEMTDRLKLVKIDGGVHTQVMNELHISGIPAFILYKKWKRSLEKRGRNPDRNFSK